ncbi:ATP-binding protein [Roseicyclus sp. F158]|uniref:ATP-binding protein n=1 Tax=Tropicimonas omnivorans TaxID=3075590 RepID=A0ABU3DHC2_9RHOB|nr:ATP-binding protein [Roseicyclus sp. F158]MDT0683122.1 ATP-binding protein [Roseicyclus sp. F158]
MTNASKGINLPVDELRNLHIGTPSYRSLKDNLARLFRAGPDGTLTHEPVLFTRGTETHGIILIAGAGAGKTPDIGEAIGSIEALTDNHETGVPRYIHVTVGSPATLRSLAVQFLEKLGLDGVGDRVKVHELWTMVRRRLQRLGISLVVVDEVHDMFRSTPGSETDAMFRMMKSLMQGDHPVVLLLGGTERLLAVTGLDAQVNRRFRKVIAQPLDCGGNADSIHKTVAFYAGKAGLALSIRDDLAVRLIHGARYRFGRCVEITIAAIDEALRAGDDTLTGQHFETAWGMEEGCPLTANVFAVEDFMSIQLEDDDEIGERIQVAREKKRRAKATPKSKRGKKVA